MARKKTSIRTSVGGKFDPGLATAFLNLAKSNGVSMHEALRRVMTQAVISRELPGISRLTIESVEREKWGEAAVPSDPSVYAGEVEHPDTPTKAQKAD